MEYRYSLLRNHLDELGYRETLVLDSVPLVERLLADLVKTTESLYHYKNVAQSAIEERDQLRLGAEPFKCDNAKLVKECNDLHLAFLQYREQTEKAQKELKRKISCLEQQNEDLNRHLITQKVGDKTSKTTYKRTIPSKTAISIKASVQKPSAVSLDSAKSVKSDKSSVKHKCSSATMDYEPHQCLMSEIKKLKAELQRSQDECDTFKMKLQNREKEIHRMSSMLEGGRPVTALNKDCCYQDMNMKLRNLAEENTKLINDRKGLEKRLEDAITKQHDAMKRALQLADRNKELERELRDIDQMALAVEEECNTAVKKNYSKVSKVQEQLQNSNCKISGLEQEIQELKRTKVKLEAENNILTEEKENLHKILENTLDDKKRMTDRINQFTRIEHDLNMEIDRLMQSCTLQKRRIADLEYQLKSNNILSATEGEISDKESTKKTGRSEKKCSKCSKTKTSKADISLDDNATIDRLQGERDYYQKECQRLCEELNNAVDPTSETDIRRTVREKEQQIKRLEKEIQDVTRDRQQLLSQLSDLNPCGEKKVTMECSTLRSTLSRAEKERDLARNDIKRLEDERDSLRRRLQQTTETHKSECDRLKNIVTCSEQKLRQMEMERREMANVTGCRKNTISQLEEQIASLSSQLRTTQGELEHIQMLYNQIKTLQEQTDRALADTQCQLTQMEREYNHSQEKCRELEKEKEQHSKELCMLKSDLCTLRGNLTKIDCQRDNLLIEVDNKTERIVALEHELKQKECKLTCLEQQLGELRQQLSCYTDEAANKEFQLRSSCQELCSIKREMDEASKIKNQLTSENRRLQNELAKVTLDWRNSTSELKSAQRQIEDVKTQLQQYVFEVKRAEDLISKKECERSKMLDQFKCLSEEANHLNTSNHCLENQAMEIKTELMKAQNHVQDLETKVLALNTLNKDYEKQISELTCHIAALESKLKKHVSGNSKIEMDLSAMKDLCVKLDGQKDKMKKELQDKEDFCMCVEKEKERMRVEINKLEDCLCKEQNNIGSLENLLAQSRQETVEQRLINSDLQQEIQRLKNMVEELQSKLTVTNQQLDVFQEKALDYSQQLKQLRREIANERPIHTIRTLNTVDVRLHSPEEQYGMVPHQSLKKKDDSSCDFMRLKKSPKDDNDTYRSHTTVDVDCPKYKTLSFQRPSSKNKLCIEPRSRSRCDYPSTADFTKATYSYNYPSGTTRSLGINTNSNTRNNACYQSNTARPFSANINSRPNTGRWTPRKASKTCNTERKGCSCGRCGVYSE